MEQSYLVVDIGTGNMRVAIVNTQGRVKGIATCDCEYEQDKAFLDSTVFKPEKWMQTLRKLMGEALAQAGPLELLAASSVSQREGIVLMDHKGSAFLGLPNIDNRALECLERLTCAKEIERITGFAPIPAFSGPKLFATRAVQPEIARRIGKVTSISEWIGYELTGRLVWEHAQAMHSLAYNHHSREWSRELCEMQGLDRAWLPPLAQSGTALGQVGDEYCRLLNCGTIPFVVGGADTQMAMVGMGMEVGGVGVISGTTTPVEKLLDRLPEKTGGWLNPHSEAGQYMLEMNAAYTGINYQRIKGLLFSDQSYEALEEEALKRGLPHCMAMFSMGLNTADGPINKGGLLFDNPLRYDLRPCDLMHAMALDIACGISMTVKALEKLSPPLQTPLMGCGGGFQGTLLPMYVAALCQRPLVIYEGYLQASVLGAVRMCERALQRQPFERRVLHRLEAGVHPALEAYYQRWLEYREALRPTNAIQL